MMELQLRPWDDAFSIREPGPAPYAIMVGALGEYFPAEKGSAHRPPVRSPVPMDAGALQRNQIHRDGSGQPMSVTHQAPGADFGSAAAIPQAEPYLLPDKANRKLLATARPTLYPAARRAPALTGKAAL